MHKHSTLPLLAVLVLAGCGSSHHHHHHVEQTTNIKPAYLGAISSNSYDGQSDDLLTAGLGKTGLAAASAPAYAVPQVPTPAELRRNAIYANYRAVLDIAASSGYGSLYGPNVDKQGTVTASEGKIAGTEYLAYADNGSGAKNVTLMVQVPASFDVNNPCIVTGTSSGSRGIYGAIGSSGEWGLKNGCAVAYSDKGSGIGLYTFDDDSVNLQNGVRSSRTAAGKNSNFTPLLTDAERAAFATTYPNRLAFKHAHSQQNPERDWGRSTLQAIEFAYYVLNETYAAAADEPGRHVVRFTRENTIVIASSISNGGGSALRAAEQDDKGLINGVAASEPQVQPASSTGYTVRQGGVPVPGQGRGIFDYATYAALYQPCIAGSAGRCTALVGKGLLAGTNLAAQQADALTRLHAYGWQSDADPLQASHATTNILVAVSYAYAYGRLSVTDLVCGFSFAATDVTGAPIAFTAAQKTGSFAQQNGIPGNVVYEPAVGGATVYTSAVSPSSGLADQALDGFLCLRSLATGVDPVSGVPLSGALALQYKRIVDGIDEVLATTNLNGKPALIVAGRSDTLLPVNHAARAYVALNGKREGTGSKLRYIEVMHANHFDSFTSAFPAAVVPLHIYLIRALDAMYAHLKSGAALPSSQLVRTTTRADTGTPITVANVPPISATPGADAIVVSGSTINVPD